MAARPLAPDHNGIVAGRGAHTDYPTRTAMHGDARAPGTLTNGGATRTSGLAAHCRRAIAGLPRRRAALLRTARDRGAALAVTGVTALAGTGTGTGARLRAGVLRLRELDAAFIGRGRNAGGNTHRCSYTE